MKQFKIILLTLLFLPFIKPLAQEEIPEKPKPLEFGFLYIGELASNLTGGIETGTEYLGLIDLSLSFNFETAGLWAGGEIYLQVENTHGGTPSGDLVGDFQVFSNIENGSYTYLYELWYKHSIGKTSVQAGIIDLNADFIVTEGGGLFSNSSFGIMPNVSMNVPVPIFPKNVLGLVFQYQVNNNFKFLTSFFDGDPSNLDEEKYNLSPSVSAEQGFLSVSEIHYVSERSGGSYKLGGYYHNGEFYNMIDSSIHNGNTGIYFIADQQLFPQKLNIFLQSGWAPDKHNLNQFYIGAGFNLFKPFSGRTDDIAGIAIGHAITSRCCRENYTGFIGKSETAIEGAYIFQIKDFLGIQPYIQYIINPGMNKSIENAFVGAVRINLEF